MPRTTLPLMVGWLLLVLSVTTLVPEAAAQAVSADEVDALFAEWDQPNSPGCALAVIHEGEIVYKNGYGTATPATSSWLRSSSAPAATGRI